MGVAQPADVVVQLDPGVVVDHRDEERHAEAVGRAEVEGGVGQRPAGAAVDRAVVGARPILAGVLETQLVEQRVAEVRDHRAGKGPGAVLFGGVGAAAPGVDVEGAVFLLRVGVVEAAGDEVRVRGLPVELAEEGEGIVGTVDRPVFVRRAERGEGVHHPLLDAAGVLLLGFGAVLGVERGEVEQRVGAQGTAQGEAGLQLLEVEFRLARAVGARRFGRQRIVLVGDVGGAGQLVGARLGDHGDEAGGGAAELGGGAVGDHHEFLHRVEVEGEGRPLAAALLAEEGVVEVGAVDRDVVLDALLAVDRELLAVRALDQRDSRGELGQLEEIAAVVGDAVEHLAVDLDRVRRAGGLDQRAFRGHHDRFLGGLDLHLDVDRQDGAEVELEAFGDQGGEAVRGGAHLVGPERQQGGPGSGRARRW